jgi:hypothetical protein
LILGVGRAASTAKTGEAIHPQFGRFLSFNPKIAELDACRGAS